MKKVIASLLCVVLIATGCSSSPKSAPTPTPEQTSAPTSAPTSNPQDVITTEEDNSELSITFPASMVENSDISDFESDDVKSVVRNDDGSITITMTKAQQANLLKELAESTKETLDEMVTDEDTMPTIESIEFNEDMTVFTAKTTATSESGLGAASFSVKFFASLVGGMYQIYSGISPEETSVTVNYVNVDSGETILSETEPAK